MYTIHNLFRICTPSAYTLYTVCMNTNIKYVKTMFEKDIANTSYAPVFVSMHQHACISMHASVRISLHQHASLCSSMHQYASAGLSIFIYRFRYSYTYSIQNRIESLIHNSTYNRIGDRSCDVTYILCGFLRSRCSMQCGVLTA